MSKQLMGFKKIWLHIRNLQINNMVWLRSKKGLLRITRIADNLFRVEKYSVEKSDYTGRGYRDFTIMGSPETLEVEWDTVKNIIRDDTVRPCRIISDSVVRYPNSIEVA